MGRRINMKHPGLSFNLVVSLAVVIFALVFGNRVTEAINLRLTARQYDHTEFYEAEVCAGQEKTISAQEIDLKVIWESRTQEVTVSHGNNKITEFLFDKPMYLVRFPDLLVLVEIKECPVP